MTVWVLVTMSRYLTDHEWEGLFSSYEYARSYLDQKRGILEQDDSNPDDVYFVIGGGHIGDRARIFKMTVDEFTIRHEK